MTHAAKFNATLESTLIDNILALVTRDMKLALDHFYAADALPDFKEKTLGAFLSLNFPALMIDPTGNDISQADDDSRLDNVLRVALFIAVTDTDESKTTRRLMKYLGCLDSVLRSAAHTDYTSGTGMFVLTTEVTHQYGPLGKGNGYYMRPASLTLQLKYSER